MVISTAPANTKRDSSEAPTAISGPVLDDELLARVGRQWLDLRAGQIVGGAEVLRLIGRGGLSSVYQVWHREFGLPMALKLPQAATLDRLTAETFSREATAWLLPARHPHVAACYYVVNVMGRPGIFMEYVEGRSLAALLDEAGSPLYAGGRDEAVARILDIMIQAARGLDYVHSLGLCNVDIKPANLLRTAEGRLLLADFAPLANTAERPVGTHQYYSPEAAENRESGQFPDLWALALSGLECFLGRRPWEAGSIVGYALEVYFEGIWALLPPPELAAFFQKALAPTMAERYHSAAEMEAALMEIYTRLTGRQYPRPVLGPLPESPERLNNKAFSFLELGRPDIAGDLAAGRPVRKPARVSPVEWFA